MSTELFTIAPPQIDVYEKQALFEDDGVTCWTFDAPPFDAGEPEYPSDKAAREAGEAFYIEQVKKCLVPLRLCPCTGHPCDAPWCIRHDLCAAENADPWELEGEEPLVTPTKS